MSLKSLIMYDTSMKRNFGYVDLGGHSTSGESNVMASDALVCMIVGMEGNWKLPLGYFLTKGLSSDVQAGKCTIVKWCCYGQFSCGKIFSHVTLMISYLEPLILIHRPHFRSLILSWTFFTCDLRLL